MSQTNASENNTPAAQSGEKALQANFPQLFGVIGHPVKHSLSPVMHNAAFRALGLPHHYHAFDVKPENLSQALQSMRVLGIQGLNVTIPHKETVIEHIDELDEEAEAIGAVNLVVKTKEGRLKGYNTDGAGYVQSLVEEGGVHLERAHPLLIGAGGAAKGIGVYLIKKGVPRLTLMNRTESKAHALAAHLRDYAHRQSASVAVDVISRKESLTADQEHYTVYINTTSLGMWPDTELAPLELQNLSSEITVSDIVYNPLTTRFLQEAKQKGARIHQGLGMFVYQGVLAFECFSGQHAPVADMRQAVLKELKREK